MNEARIKRLISEQKLRIREPNKSLMRSLLEAAEQTTKAQARIPLDENTAPIIFKSVYDAIRQLGDVKWLLKGYETRTHELSIEFLMEEDPVAFMQLDRFRIIRNDASYRGFKITIEHAKEITQLWKTQGTTLLSDLKQKVS